jgi:NAD(P)-dependent dehydrogenase (short-subunit alcohol dehydrogenase family)
MLTGGAFVGKAAKHRSTPIAVVHALKGLTESLALELKPLRVNIVAAGMVKSHLWKELLGDNMDAVFASASAGFPLGRPGTPQEMAQGFIYLMKQTFSTGMCLLIDGGMQV